MADRRLDVCICGGRSEVTETRAMPYGIRRRRRCPKCDTRWTTVEVDGAMFTRIVAILDSLRAVVGPLMDLPGADELAGEMGQKRLTRWVNKLKKEALDA